MLGTKEEMTQVFTEEGKVIPVTVLSAGPTTVTQVKTTEKDGYDAVQVGFGSKSEKKMNKAEKGHLKGKGPFRVMREVPGASEAKEGDTFSIGDVFAEGDVVDVSGINKGKGFQGGVKRHGFAGGRRSHGQKHSEREVGSIGATGPQRVFKGQRMPGHMGAANTTVKNLRVVGIDKENNKLLISGAIPGRRGTIIEIRGVNK